MVDREVKGMTLDSTGFIWLTSSSGLMRFDGARFHIFNNTPSADYLLDFNYGHEIYTDRDGTLLAERYPFGLDRIDPKNGSVVHLNFEPISPDEPRYMIHTHQASDGRVIVLFQRELFLDFYQYKSGKTEFLFTLSTPGRNIPSNSYFVDDRLHLYSPEEDVYYLGALGYGIFKITDHGTVQTRVSTDQFHGKEKDKIPHFFMRNSCDQVLYGSDAIGLGILNDTILKRVKRDFGEISFRFASTDRKGNVLFQIADTNITRFAFLLYNCRTKRWKRLELGGRLNFPVLDMFSTDFEKYFYLASDHGLYHVRSKPIKVETFFTDYRSKKRNREIGLRGMLKVDSNLVFITSDNCNPFFFNRTTRAVDTIKPTEDMDIEAFTFSRNVVKDDKGNIYFSTFHNESGQFGVVRISVDREIKLVQCISRIQTIEWIGSDTVLAYGNEGLEIVDFSSDTSTKFEVMNKSELINRGFPEKIRRTSNGELFIMGWRGLGSLDMNKHEITAIPGPDSIFYLKHITEFVEYKKETYLIGTYGYGVYLWNARSNFYVNINTSNGLPSNTIASITPDQSVGVWVATYDGLAVWNIDNSTIQSYSIADGLTSNEFNRHSNLLVEPGVVFLGAINGLNTISFEGRIKEKKGFNTLISSITFDRNRTGKLSKSFFSQTGQIHIPPDVRFFSMELGSDQFFAPQTTQFRYRLSESNADWIELGESRVLEIPYLPRGNYQLQIQASSSYDNWEGKIRTVALHVEDHFFRTPGFIIGVIVLIALIIIVFIRFRSAKQLEMERMRMSIARNLHDEVGSSVTHLKMLAEQISNMRQGLEQGDTIEKMKTLLAESSNNIRDVVWSINTQYDNVESLVDRMVDFAYEILSTREIKVYFHRNIERKNPELPPLIRQNLYLIFKEAVTNIVRHSRAEEVEITLTLADDRFEMELINNGVTEKIFNPNWYKMGGNGLGNMTYRANQINGKLFSEKGNGKFRLRIQGQIK